MYSWSSWHTLVPLLLGIASLVVFTPYEIYVATEPMFSFSIFGNWTQRLVFFQTFIHGIILFVLLYYGPIYFEAVQGYSPTITGIAMFPETFTVAPASIVVGILTSVTGRYRWALWSGWVITTLGMGIRYLQDVNTTIQQWIFIDIVPGLGTGMLFASMAIAIPAATKTPDMALAVAFFSFTRALGQGVGVAIGGTIFQNQFKKKLLAYPLLAGDASAYSRDAAGLIRFIALMEGGLRKKQLLQAYADSLKVLWLVMCGLAALALVSSAFVKGYSLDVALETEQGFKHGKKIVDVERSDLEGKEKM